MTYYVYILACVSRIRRRRTTIRTYTGMTKDPVRRITEHLEGRGARFTRGFKPVAVLRLEKHPTIESAMRREREWKKLPKSLKMSFYRSSFTSERLPPFIILRDVLALFGTVYTEEQYNLLLTTVAGR